VKRSARSELVQPMMRSLRRNHGRPRTNRPRREIRDTVRAERTGESGAEHGRLSAIGRSGDQRGTRRICRTITGRRCEQSRSRPSRSRGPSTSRDAAGSAPTSAGCSVCGLEKATWAGPANTGVRLCEYCYGRELRYRS
jgi:hypothetical protein